MEVTFEMLCKLQMCKQLQTVRGIFSLQAHGPINQQMNLRKTADMARVNRLGDVSDRKSLKG